MDAVPPQDEQALRAQLGQARERLDGLLCDLRAVDGELEDLAPEREQHRLLHEACCALETLGELGGAGLFWGERPAGEGEQQLLLVRSRLDAFQARLSEIESRRQKVVEKMQLEEENAEILEDDLYEAQRREEQRKMEWVVERDVSSLPARELVMPWSRGGEDDARFRRSLALSVLASLLVGLVIPQINLPLPEPWEAVDVPERLAKLIKEERPLPPPPQREEPEPDETLPDPDPVEPAPSESPTERAASKGILAFREKFSGLAMSDPTDRLGLQARISSSEAPSGQPERSMVTTQAPGSSGGINLAALSRDVGGTGDRNIEGVRVTRATSAIGGGGGGGPGRPRSGGPGSSRTDEEIQIVFDRHKAALYRLYNRELRKDPTLKGQMVLRIRIEPDGSVSACELHASDMKAPQLSAQVVARVKTFDFGAKEDIPTVTILYPIDFLPAARVRG